MKPKQNMLTLQQIRAGLVYSRTLDKKAFNQKSTDQLLVKQRTAS